MKTLHIIRHAKSSWNFTQLDDFSRPIGSRGRKDVRLIGKHLARKGLKPDIIICSPASRAFYTALHLADQIKYPEEEIHLEPALYHAGDEEIIDTIIEYGQHLNSVALVGHNPGLTNLVNSLQKEWVDNFPTCAVMSIVFNINEWEEININKGHQSFFTSPKTLKKD